MVAVAARLYCTPFITHTLDAEMAELKRSIRLAAAWIQTNGVDNGIVVISYYGISGATADVDNRKVNDIFLMALWKYLAHHRKKPIFLRMDANFHIDKSEVLQAMTTA